MKPGQVLTTYEDNHITQLFTGTNLIGAPGSKDIAEMET